MRAFLTGATGFIGKTLTAALRRRGWEVVALVRNPTSPQASALAGLGATLVPGDVTNPESLRAPMTGADLVIHNAGIYEVGVTASEAWRMEQVNVRGTDHVLSLALQLGIPRTVYVSTVQAFGDSGNDVLRDETFQRQTPPRTHYERTKTEAHEIALRYQREGLPLVIVCPNGVIGPNDHSIWGYFVRLHIAGLMPSMAWCPDNRYALVELQDLAEGIALAAEKGKVGETYFLAGEPLSLRQHFDLWRGEPGGMWIRLWLPWWFMWISLWPVEPLLRLAGLPAFLSRETVQEGRTSLNYSSAKAQRELGWTPRSAAAMWRTTFEGERAFLASRTRRDLVRRLNPVAGA